MARTKLKEKSPEQFKTTQEIQNLLVPTLLEAFRTDPTELWVVKVDGVQIRTYGNKEFFFAERDAKLGLLNYIKFINKFHTFYQRVSGGIPVYRYTNIKWAKEVRQVLLDSGRVTIERIR